MSDAHFFSHFCHIVYITAATNFSKCGYIVRRNGNVRRIITISFFPLCNNVHLYSIFENANPPSVPWMVFSDVYVNDEPPDHAPLITGTGRFVYVTNVTSKSDVKKCKVDLSGKWNEKGLSFFTCMPSCFLESSSSANQERWHHYMHCVSSIE